MDDGHVDSSRRNVEHHCDEDDSTMVDFENAARLRYFNFWDGTAHTGGVWGIACVKQGFEAHVHIHPVAETYICLYGHGILLVGHKKDRDVAKHDSHITSECRCSCSDEHTSPPSACACHKYDANDPHVDNTTTNNDYTEQDRGGFHHNGVCNTNDGNGEYEYVERSLREGNAHFIESNVPHAMTPAHGCPFVILLYILHDGPFASIQYTYLTLNDKVPCNVTSTLGNQQLKIESSHTVKNSDDDKKNSNDDSNSEHSTSTTKKNHPDSQSPQPRPFLHLPRGRYPESITGSRLPSLSSYSFKSPMLALCLLPWAYASRLKGIMIAAALVCVSPVAVLTGIFTVFKKQLKP